MVQGRVRGRATPEPVLTPEEVASNAESKSLGQRLRNLKQKLTGWLPDRTNFTDTEYIYLNHDKHLQITSDEDEHTVSYEGMNHPLEAVQDKIEGKRQEEIYYGIPNGRRVATCHPLTPFPTNTLEWQSKIYDDGTTYEGLWLLDMPWLKGTVVMGYQSGGGFQYEKEGDLRGDKYEGEFRMGVAHGVGIYTKPNGYIYRGEFKFARRHGCGSAVDLAPFHQKMKEGVDPDEAWEQTKDYIESSKLEGTWYKDFFVREPDPTGTFCSKEEIDGVLSHVSETAERARQFTFKPDGEVGFVFSQDAAGLPIPAMQDPLLYPHGTGWMAPGPMGQCFPLPDDDNLKAHMVKVAENKRCVWNMYNFDYKTQPGTDMWEAEKAWHHRLKRQNVDLLYREYLQAKKMGVSIVELRRIRKNLRRGIRRATVFNDMSLARHGTDREPFASNSDDDEEALEEPSDEEIPFLTREQENVEEYDYESQLVTPFVPYEDEDRAQAEEEQREIEVWDAEDYDRKYYPGPEFIRNHLLARARGIWEPEKQVEKLNYAVFHPEEDDSSNAEPKGAENQGSDGMAKAPFGSMTLSMHHAALQLTKAVDFVAARAQRRRGIMRPT